MTTKQTSTAHVRSPLQDRQLARVARITVGGGAAVFIAATAVSVGLATTSHSTVVAAPATPAVSAPAAANTPGSAAVAKAPAPAAQAAPALRPPEGRAAKPLAPFDLLL